MATDEEYMNFLEKANRDPNEGFATAQASSQRPTRRELKAQDPEASVPAAIKAVTTDKFFASEADEPFRPVVLAWDEAGKTLPDEGWPPVHDPGFVIACSHFLGQRSLRN